MGQTWEADGDVVAWLRMMEENAQRTSKVMYGRAAEEIERLRKENAELRAGWCLAYAGTHAYTDDGELQDGRHPVIDFKRDPVDVIRSKMRRRNEIVLMGEDGG